MKTKNLMRIIFIIICASQINAQEIFDAVNRDSLQLVQSILEKNPEQISARNARGTTPLIQAASKGNIEIVKFLLDKGADVNEENNFKTTSLQFAAFFDNLDLIKLLVERGANINAINLQNQCAVYYSATKGGFEAVKYLAEKGADINFKDNTGNTLLHKAAESGNGELIKFLISEGLDVEAKNVFAKTPIYYVVEKGLKEIFDFISSNGINDLTAVTIDGNSYLHAAAKGGLVNFAAKLIGEGVDVNKKNIFGSSAFSIASANNNEEFIKLLVDNGADSSNKTPILSGDYLGMELPGTTPVLFAPGIVSTAEFNERDVTNSLDGNEFYFTRWPMNRVWNIMLVKRENGTWLDPEPASFMKPYLHAEACLTPDDQQMYFISNRPKEDDGSAENWEIWFTERKGADWDNPKLLGEDFKGGFYPTFTNDWTMYYTNANADIGRAFLVDGKYTKIESLDENVNSELAEYNSCIAPDESYLIFSKDDIKDSFGEGDLYICFRNEDGSWTKARNMGNVINSWARDYCPAISRDGKYFFFSSRKYGTEDIFWVSTKIFEDMKN